MVFLIPKLILMEAQTQVIRSRGEGSNQDEGNQKHQSPIKFISISSLIIILNYNFWIQAGEK